MEKHSHRAPATGQMAIIAILAATAILATTAVLAHRHVRSRRLALASLHPKGYQEATIVINGCYRPDTILVAQGVPARFHFVRKEADPCSEWVIFSAFGVDRQLPAFRQTTVEFMPTTPGTFLFTCQWGMYRGRLIVRAKEDSFTMRRRFQETLSTSKEVPDAFDNASGANEI